LSVAGAELFGRVVRVEVGLSGATSHYWEGLRVGFEVVKTGTRTPNKAKVEVYNLTKESSALFQDKNAVVRLLAGYRQPQELFIGDCDKAVREQNGTDWLTKVEASDGGRKFRTGFVSQTFAVGSSTSQMLAVLSAAAGLPVGYAVGFQEVYLTQPLVLNGPVRDCLDALAKAIDSEWSIQGGRIQVLAAGAVAPGEGVILSPASGLVGSPTKTKKGIELTCLLQPMLAPGVRFMVQSRDVSGTYKCQQVTHKGDSGWSDEFYTSVVAVAS
jgi:hypothetical protein